MKKLAQRVRRIARTARGVTQELRRSRFVHGLIVLLIASLLGLATLAFFVKPAYEKGVWIIILCMTHLATGAASFLFGITVPGPGYSLASGDSDAPTVKCPKCGHRFDVREG